VASVEDFPADFAPYNLGHDAFDGRGSHRLRGISTLGAGFAFGLVLRFPIFVGSDWHPGRPQATQIVDRRETIALMMLLGLDGTRRFLDELSGLSLTHPRNK
jgi:hypothetical protein